MPLKNLEFKAIENLWESFYIVHKHTMEYVHPKMWKNTLRLTQLLKVYTELLQAKKELALNDICDERLLAVMKIIAKDGILWIHLLF